ncbi:hypothetical protein QCA50_007215 [Cerrena zonata]|uniref:Uncharacterized protein n=1 Tax=Cerrena zonata TaxID=2478898 RepID=A0AAW0G6Z4_9APHY
MVVADQAQIHMVAIRDNETLLAIRVLQEMDEKDRSNEQRAELAAWQVQERNLEAFWCFERLIPNLRKTITDSGPAYLRNFYATIKKGASEARSSDLSTVSKHVGVFLNERVPRPDPLLKTLGRDIRMNRGIEHDTCLRLMLPIDLEDTDETFRRIRDPTDTLDLRSSFFARLFYPDFTGNRENVKAGFLRSQLLVLLYQVVFTSPSSAGSLNVERAVQTRTRPSRAVRGPVADILHMGKHVTLQSITYISVLAYVALTNASQWYSAYNGMDYTAMYNFIIDSFQPGSEHLRELLEWWDRQIFGNTPQSDVTGATITQRSMQLLNAQ